MWPSPLSASSRRSAGNGPARFGASQKRAVLGYMPELTAFSGKPEINVRAASQAMGAASDRDSEPGDRQAIGRGIEAEVITPGAIENMELALATPGPCHLLGDREGRAQGIDGAGEKPAGLGNLPLLRWWIVGQAHQAMGTIGEGHGLARLEQGELAGVAQRQRLGRGDPALARGQKVKRIELAQRAHEPAGEFIR